MDVDGDDDDADRFAVNAPSLSRLGGASIGHAVVCDPQAYFGAEIQIVHAILQQ
jgi:hypothetical protein